MDGGEGQGNSSPFQKIRSKMRKKFQYIYLHIEIIKNISWEKNDEKQSFYITN
jgi:hypothetical protein